MVVQSKNNVSASILPDLSDDSEVKVSEKKEPTAIVATETIEEPAVIEDLNAPDEVESIEVSKTDKEPVVIEKSSLEPAPAPVSEQVSEPVSTTQASVVPEVSPVESAEASQPSQTPPVKTSSTEKREEIPLEKKNAKLYKIGTVLLVLILISTIGVFYMRTKTTTVTTKVEGVIASPTPEAIPEPTPEIIALERDEITLEILNGTSTSGLAGKTASIFEELGYEIGDVGNSDDASQNQLYVKTEFADQLENLLEDVKDELDITEVTKEVDDLDVTARIILGGE